MTPAARVAAAIEVLGDIETRRRPAAEAMKDWGLSHRFAGSGDRAAIVEPRLRRAAPKGSSAWLLGEASARGRSSRRAEANRAASTSTQSRRCSSGEGHAPAPLTAIERERLATADLRGAPAACAPATIPNGWRRVRRELRRRRRRGGSRARRAGAGRSARNLLKTSRDKALSALAHLSPQSDAAVAGRPAHRHPARRARTGARRRAGLCERARRGAGRRLAARGAAVRGEARPAGPRSLRRRRRQDARAGREHGQSRPDLRDRPDGRRLAPIFDRLERSGARNVQVRAPRGAADVLADLEGRCDLVLIDAPCTGSGAWRRNPDAKWRMRPGALEQRIKDQDETLENALRFVKPRRPDRLCHLLGPEARERGSRRRIPRPP